MPEFTGRVSHVKGGRTPDQPPQTEEDTPDLCNSEEFWHRGRRTGAQPAQRTVTPGGGSAFSWKTKGSPGMC